MRKKMLQVGLILLLALFPAVIGCSKVTQENLDKIKSGMTYSEVIGILGKPTSCDTILGGKSCVWKNGDKSIDVQFLSDKVIFFSGRRLG